MQSLFYCYYVRILQIFAARAHSVPINVSLLYYVELAAAALSSDQNEQPGTTAVKIELTHILCFQESFQALELLSCFHDAVRALDFVHITAVSLSSNDIGLAERALLCHYWNV
jgi:hypothetical protein